MKVIGQQGTIEMRPRTTGTPYYLARSGAAYVDGRARCHSIPPEGGGRLHGLRGDARMSAIRNGRGK
jgi:hypothetical protein